MKQAVLSISGGMDSTALLLQLLRDDYSVKCYSFDYGQKHVVELERVKINMEFLQKKISDLGKIVSHQVINLRDAFNESKSALTSDSGVPKGHYAEDNMKKTVVENRNMIFASIIYSKALSWVNETKEPVSICLGVHSGDHQIYPDCTLEFRHQLHQAFVAGNWNADMVDFFTPYMGGNKTTILQDAIVSCRRLGLDFNTFFRNTNTCYSPDNNGYSCGECGSCVERVEAFINIGVEDPVKYIDCWGNVKKHVKTVLSTEK